MKKIIYLLLLIPNLIFSQEQNAGYNFDVNNFYGKIVKHSDNISHLINQSPEGVLISFNKKTFGKKSWESLFNYPDYGVSFQYQNNKNETLGDLYGLYAHYNFYFLKRNLMLRIAQGVAYNTNPYDAQTNPLNVAYGTNYMPATYFMLNYKKENIWNNLGLQAGLSFFHHSNANLRAPNTSTNTVAINVGAVYSFQKSEENSYKKYADSVDFKEPLRYNLAFRTGFTESDAIGSGQFPFYVFSGYIDKRLSRKSAVQFGVDFFMMKYLEQSVRFIAAVNPEVSPETDYRKGGIFIGHELFINNFTVETQFGYYAYRPLDYLDPVYQRLGLKYYFTKQISLGVGLKTHMAKAEAMEFSLGFRL
jgi:hypothetical protein